MTGCSVARLPRGRVGWLKAVPAGEKEKRTLVKPRNRKKEREREREKSESWGDIPRDDGVKWNTHRAVGRTGGRSEEPKIRGAGSRER